MSTRTRPVRRTVLLSTAAVLALAAATLDAVQRRPPTLFAGGESSAVARMDATELARRIREGSRARIIDVRDSARFAAFTIPGAEHAASASLVDAGVGDTIVVLADRDNEAESRAASLSAPGATTVVLRGGMRAWISDVLAPPAPGLGATAAQLERHRKAIALSNWFGGLPPGIEVPSAADSALRAPIVRRDRGIFRGC